MYQSLNTGSQIDETKEMAYNPTRFDLKAITDTPMNQLISVIDTYQDVVFVGISFEVGGTLTYDGQVVKNVGTLPIKMDMNLACSITSTVINTVVHIGQSQNGTIDVGAESSAKVESNTGAQSLNIATTFILQPGDELNLQIKADKVATIGIDHLQVVLKQSKVAV